METLPEFASQVVENISSRRGKSGQMRSALVNCDTNEVFISAGYGSYHYWFKPVKEKVQPTVEGVGGRSVKWTASSEMVHCNDCS